jgi:hypothetical protein
MTSPSALLTPAQEAVLPTDKHDSTNALTHLATLPSIELKPLIPHLLYWLQDANWPIFSSVRELLLQHSEIAVEPVRAVLRGDDGEWLKNCLESIVLRMPRRCQLMLREEIERVARSPTDDEKEWEAEVIAEGILGGLDGISEGGEDTT